MKKSYTVLFTFLISVLLIPMLTACGGTTSDGVEFIIANGAEPEALDPHLISGTVESRINRSLFEAMYTQDPQTSQPLNGLVVSEKVSADATVYTFTLRKGIVWSDGKPITSDDVVFSLRRILDPAFASPYAWFPALFIKNGVAYNKGNASVEELGVRKIDDRTFEFKLVGPLPYVKNALTHYAFGIVPKHVVEAYGSEWTLVENIVTSGAFVLEKWSPQDELVVKKNPLYWDADSVELDRVVFIASDDLNTNYNAYINKEVDWMLSTPQGRLDEARLRDDYYVAPTFATYYYSIQFHKPELSDVRVRQALALSIDKEDLVENVTRGGQIPSDALVPPLSDYQPVDGLHYNVERAQKLLAEAGYPGGQGYPELTLLYNTSEGHKRIAEYIQQEWEENLGIKIKLENMEWKTFLKERRAGAFQVTRNGWVGDYLDPNTFLDLYGSGGGSNEIQYANAEYDAFLAQAAQTQDVTTRMGFLKQAEALLIEKDVALIPIYYYTSSNMFDNTKWEGFYNNIANVHELKYIKLKK